MRCKNCGWENPDGSQKCEKCNNPLQGGVVSSPQQGNSGHSTILDDPIWESPKKPTGTIIEEPVNEKPEQTTQPGSQTDSTDFGKTINSWGVGSGYTPKFHCVLKPNRFPGEDLSDAPKDVNLKGNSIKLNRQLIDPDNNTITSDVQAILICEDGKWYIQDKSTYKSTYVYAGEPVPLKTGDVILMGNRTFVFEQEK